MRSPYPARTDRPLSLARAVAILIPNALLWGAIGFQYLGGLHPCEMCYWQRWPHLAAIVLALGAIAARRRPGTSAALTVAAALAILTSGLIGGFHAGVEYGWWQGVTRCASNFSERGGQSAIDAIMAAPLVRCDVAAWTMGGISMAGYNFLISVASALAILLLVSRTRSGRA